MNNWPSAVCSMSWMMQMLRWLVADAACASRRNRCCAPSSWLHCGGRNFRATARPSLVSIALYTTPIPPPPILATTSYWEMILPIRGSAAVLSKIENHGRYTTGKRRPRTVRRAPAAGGRGHGERVHARAVFSSVQRSRPWCSSLVLGPSVVPHPWGACHSRPRTRDYGTDVEPSIGNHGPSDYTEPNTH